MTIGDEESGQYFYADDNGIKKGVIAYDYTSLFPTLTSDVRYLHSSRFLQICKNQSTLPQAITSKE